MIPPRREFSLLSPKPEKTLFTARKSPKNKSPGAFTPHFVAIKQQVLLQ
jgi:hypothetical protein